VCEPFYYRPLSLDQSLGARPHVRKISIGGFARAMHPRNQIDDLVFERSVRRLRSPPAAGRVPMAITSTEVTIILSVGAVMLAFLGTQHSQTDDVAFCSWSRQRWHEPHDEPPARPRRNVGYVSGDGSDDAYQISGPGRPKSVLCDMRGWMSCW